MVNSIQLKKCCIILNFCTKLDACNTLNKFLDNCHNEREEYAMIESVEVICKY